MSEPYCSIDHFLSKLLNSWDELISRILEGHRYISITCANINNNPLALCAVVGGVKQRQQRNYAVEIFLQSYFPATDRTSFSFHVFRSGILFLLHFIIEIHKDSPPWDGHWEWCCRWQRVPPRLERQRQRWQSAVAACWESWSPLQCIGRISSKNGKTHHLGFTVKLPAVGFIAAMYLETVWFWGEHWYGGTYCVLWTSLRVSLFLQYQWP